MLLTQHRAAARRPARVAAVLQVEQGAELLSERTATEQKKLKNVRGGTLHRAVEQTSMLACNRATCGTSRAAVRIGNGRSVLLSCCAAVPAAAAAATACAPQKPESWRLACQTIVGDGSNSGSVVIRTKPQAK